MDEFTIVTVISRPLEDVFAVLVDVDRTPLWMPGLSEACITSEGPLEMRAIGRNPPAALYQDRRAPPRTCKGRTM